MKTVTKNIMKNMSVRWSAVLCVFGALLSLAPRTSGSQSCCIIMPTAPGNHAVSEITVYYPTSLDADSWFTTTLSDSVGPIPAGVYATWCVDAHTDINPEQSTLPGTTYSGDLVSTCDLVGLAGLPTRTDDNPPVGPPSDRKSVM